MAKVKLQLVFARLVTTVCNDLYLMIPFVHDFAAFARGLRELAQRVFRAS